MRTKRRVWEQGLHVPTERLKQLPSDMDPRIFWVICEIRG